MEAYLDNAATTSVFPEVRDIMNTLMEEDFGNPSSKHTKGMIAEKYINDARDIICSQLKCDAREIVFTLGFREPIMSAKKWWQECLGLKPLNAVGEGQRQEDLAITGEK